jgi:hypothetical protein
MNSAVSLCKGKKLAWFAEESAGGSSLDGYSNSVISASCHALVSFMYNSVYVYLVLLVRV